MYFFFLTKVKILQKISPVICKRSVIDSIKLITIYCLTLIVIVSYSSPHTRHSEKHGFKVQFTKRQLCQLMKSFTTSVVGGWCYFLSHPSVFCSCCFQKVFFPSEVQRNCSALLHALISQVLFFLRLSYPLCTFLLFLNRSLSQSGKRKNSIENKHQKAGRKHRIVPKGMSKVLW